MTTVLKRFSLRVLKYFLFWPGTPKIHLLMVRKPRAHSLVLDSGRSFQKKKKKMEMEIGGSPEHLSRLHSYRDYFTKKQWRRRVACAPSSWHPMLSMRFFHELFTYSINPTFYVFCHFPARLFMCLLYLMKSLLIQYELCSFWTRTRHQNIDR